MRSSIWGNLGERLSNYVAMQRPIAESKGVWEQLQKARNLTQARRIVYGVKTKAFGCKQCGRKGGHCIC